MERDFLGLGSKNVALNTKDEFPDNSKNSASALMGASGMQWSFSNKVSAVPQLLSFRAAQDERQRKNVLDPLLSNGYVTASNTDIPNLNHRPFSAVIQKNAAPDKKAGNQYAAISNLPKNACPLTFNVPVLQSQLVSPGQTVVGSNVNVQPFGGVPIATPVSVLPSTGPFIGTTDLRNSSKSPGSLAQLTIFYAGSVCVYNDISPETARAIMVLAGSQPTQTQNNMLATGQAQPSFHSDGFKGVPVLGLSSAPSVTVTHPKGSHAGAVSCSSSELPTAKPIQTSLSHANRSEPPKTTAPKFVPSAVPQARKASLVRFLEKRKERINATPYGYSVAKKMADDCTSATLYLTA